MGDRVGVLACELVDVADRLDGLRLRFPAFSVVLHNRRYTRSPRFVFFKCIAHLLSVSIALPFVPEYPAYPRIMPMDKKKSFMQVGGAYNMRVIVRGAWRPQERSCLCGRKEAVDLSRENGASQSRGEGDRGRARDCCGGVDSGRLRPSAFDVEVFGTPLFGCSAERLAHGSPPSWRLWCWAAGCSPISIWMRRSAMQTTSIAGLLPVLIFLVLALGLAIAARRRSRAAGEADS